MILYKYVRQEIFIEHMEEYLAGWLYFADKNNFKDYKDQDVLSRFRVDPARVGDLEYNNRFQERRDFIDNFKICCLSKNCGDSNEMWGLYGGIHNGVCIGIEIGVGKGCLKVISLDGEEKLQVVPDDFNIGNSIISGDINYPPKGAILPNIKYKEPVTLDDIQTLFFYKDGFREEEEHRLIISNDAYMYPVGTVREIILGINFPHRLERCFTKGQLGLVTRFESNENADGAFVKLSLAADQLFDWKPDTVEKSAKIVKYKGKKREVFIPSWYKQDENIYPVTAIGDGVFARTNITRIDIPDSVKEIGRSAFSGCTKLKEVKLPANLNKIGESLFKGCTALPFIDIPKYADEIEWWSFEGCTSLTEVKIPDSVTEIGGEAFKDCTALESITLGGSVKRIDKRAFYDCWNLRKIIIPKSVEEISSEGVFSNCSNLTRIDVLPGNRVYTSKDGSLLRENGTILQSCPSGKTGEYLVPDGIAIIEQESCCGCEKITSVFIPDSVKKIKQWAFEHCVLLASITLPRGIKTEEVEDEAFYECDLLRKTDVLERFGVRVFSKPQSEQKGT